jgi:hypothetical protein
VIRVGGLVIKVGLALMFTFLMYSDSQVNLMVHEIIVACMLGYGAFLYREQVETNAPHATEFSRT